MFSSDHHSYSFRIFASILFLVVCSPRESFSQDSEDRVDIGGYGSFRLDADDSDEGAASFTMRRFVITTDARVGRRLTVYSELEYERLTKIEVERAVERSDGGLVFEQELEGTNGGEIALEQAWGQFQISDAFSVRFGAVLPPVGRFNLAHDDNLWNLPRRPLLDRAAVVLPAKAAWTEMGLGLIGSVFVGKHGRVSYQAYLLTGTSLDFTIEEKVQTRTPKRNKLELEVAVSPTQGAFDGSNAADAFAGRVEVSPRLGSEYAVSGYIGQYTPSYLDTNKSLASIAFDGKQRVGPIDVEAEFVYSHYSAVDQVLFDFAQAAVDGATETEASETAALENEIEIEIGGLATNRYGFWIDLSHSVALKQGTLGLADPLLIPVLRYERVYLDDNVDTFDFADGLISELSRSDVKQSRISVGLAFRPVPQGVFHLTYSRSTALEGHLIDPALGTSGSVNSVTLGLAVGF